MALLKKKSRNQGADQGGRDASQLAQPQSRQQAPSQGSSDQAPLGSGLERKWEQAWQRARSR